jgi:hypothetical protein
MRIAAEHHKVKSQTSGRRTCAFSNWHLDWRMAHALSASLDSSYMEYFSAIVRGLSTKEAERRIPATPEDKRYPTKVLDSHAGTDPWCLR